MPEITEDCRIAADNKLHLDQLATELASNYCTVSFGETEKEEVTLESLFDPESSILKGKKPKDNLTKIKQHRNILVIGAGATFDSYKCIPLGKDVIDGFEAKYLSKIKDFPAINERYENYKNDLRIQGGVLDFENYLSLFAELILTPEELRKELSELYNFRYCPSLFYEIVAHLFKHSFIDVIINFNFDELLDRAILEEIGKENYFQIVSDGDCISIDDVTVDGRLKIPIYVKPHGTISYKNSLRFTKRHYLDVPEKIKDLLKKLISGKRGEVDSMKKVFDINQVNIISVGFNMASIEFNDILNESLPVNSKFYHFAYDINDERDPHFIQKILPQFYDRAFKNWTINRETIENNEIGLADFDKSIYKRIAVKNINDDTYKNILTTPYSEFFSYLWRTVYSHFREELRPRSIGSHEIVSYLFYDHSYSQRDSNYSREMIQEQYERNMYYFLDRAIVEIAIALNRNNGIVEIAQILGDRVGFYYSQYRKHYLTEFKSSKGLLSIYDLVSQFVEEDDREDTFFTTNIFRIKVKTDLKKGFENKLRHWELAKFVNLNTENPDFSKNLELVNVIIEKISAIDFDTNDCKFRISSTVLYYLFTCKLLSANFITNFKNNHDKLIFNYKLYIYDGLEKKYDYTIEMFGELIRLFCKSTAGHFYTIKPRYHDPKNYLTQSFSRTKILHTNLALEYKFKEMIYDESWDIALIISENGGLLNFLEKSEMKILEYRKKVIMINSVEAVKQLFSSDVLKQEETKVAQINEQRNQHYQSLFNGVTQKSKIETFTYSIPAIQHNHHMMIFIKKVNPSDHDQLKTPFYKIDNENIFKMAGALYMFRRGFSNSINPIFIGMQSYHQADNLKALNNDFRKLLGMFTINLSRALAYVKDYNPLKFIINIENYMSWSANEEKEVLNKFLKHLYTDVNDLNSFKPNV